jgi:hypothetical protein
MVLGRERKSVWERKGRKLGRCLGFIQAERGGRGSGRGQAAGGLAIDGRRAIRNKGARGEEKMTRNRGRFDCGELLP